MDARQQQGGWKGKLSREDRRQEKKRSERSMSFYLRILLILYAEPASNKSLDNQKRQKA